MSGTGGDSLCLICIILPFLENQVIKSIVGRWKIYTKSGIFFKYFHIVKQKGDESLEKWTGVMAIVGMCLLVLFLVTVKRKAEMFLNFCIRTVLGGISICGINFLLVNWGIPCVVGINPCSLLTSGILGFSGVSLLYAISAFPLL